MVRRELGEGRWDKVLMRRMVNLSVADNYDEAKEEWLATGSVWWRGNGEIEGRIFLHPRYHRSELI